jgi:hypothetical protein
LALPLLTLTLAIAGGMTARAAAEPLWQTFDLGASKEAVLSQYPSARLDKANSSPSVENYRVEGVPEQGMWAYFTFADGLREVRMHGRGATNFLRAVRALTERYGEPVSSSQAGNSSVARWDREITIIEASLRQDENLGAGVVNRSRSSILQRG